MCDFKTEIKLLYKRFSLKKNQVPTCYDMYMM